MKTVRQMLASKGHEVLSTSPKHTVYDALLVMSKHHVGALAVLENDKLVGIFSERDYARSVTIEDKNAKNTLVTEIMSHKVITVTPDNTVDDCMNLMSGRRIRHLPVVENDKLVGMLSIGDLVKETIAYQAFLIQQLEGYIQS